MTNEILYRKWRPRSFAELAGQDHVATTLKNALAGGRIAHAYLFAGPRGTGKTSTARLLGKALNCTNRSKGEACNACESCLAFLAGRAMDLIELDAASNRGIDEIRSLRDKVAFAAAGEYKVYLIDEVHMLTDAAFNALLKTLEEPPPHVVFILATTEAHKLPATITSRCQRFDFRRIPLSASVETLQRICEGEGIKCEPAALELIARSATGSLRDATNLLDQLATSYGQDLTLEHVRAGLGLIGDARAGQLARLAIAGDLGGGLALIASVRDDGLDLRQFQRELVSELRALLMAKSGLDPEEGATPERRAELRAAIAAVETPQLLTALRAFGEADLKLDPNSTLPLDIALAECALGQSGNRGIGQSDTVVKNQAPKPDVGATFRSPTTPQPGKPSAPKAETPAQAPTSFSPDPAKDLTPSVPQEPVQGATLPGGMGGVPPQPLSNQGGADERDAQPDASLRSGSPPSIANSSGGSAALTPAALRDNMRLIYQKARTASPTLGALLNSGCDIIKADEREVIFGFRFRNHATKASEKVNLDAIQAIFSELVGREVAVACRFEEGVTDWKQREAARGKDSPLVRAAQEMGARLISEDGPPSGG
jgi:DNA polymerase-3 subunit gamma/tau